MNNTKLEMTTVPACSLCTRRQQVAFANRTTAVFVIALLCLGPAKLFAQIDVPASQPVIRHGIKADLAGPDGIETDPLLLALKRHVTVLASDTFEGREAGTRGGQAAAAYIVNQLRNASVQPVPGQGFLQEFGQGYRNVLAWIPGTDPKIRNEVILAGGHFDHVGYGTKANSNGQIGQIHNGADDNASGVAGLIELARSLTRTPCRRSVLLAFWDAEEKGLVGSSFWTSRPTVNLNSIRIAFNADMIGRLRKNQLEVCGTRTAAGLRRLMTQANQTENLELEFNWDIVKDSDHYPFVERGIPFLFFCTKKHSVYHHPDDDISTLNYKGLTTVCRLMERTIRMLADGRPISKYRTMARFETQASKKKLNRLGLKQPSRMGITYVATARGKGPVVVRSVTRGSTANKAGIKPGDTIYVFDGHDLKSADFPAAVQTAASPVEVVIRRRGETQNRTLTMNLKGQPVRFGMKVRDDESEPGVMIAVSVVPGLPAEKAGVQAEDRVHSINRKRFADGDAFWNALATTGQRTTLEIERNGRLFQAVLESNP